jgi:glutathione S-transferase
MAPSKVSSKGVSQLALPVAEFAVDMRELWMIRAVASSRFLLRRGRIRDAFFRNEAFMKLYYLKGACSLASYISLIEAGQKFEGVEVERGTKKAADGKNLADINPKGYVPALVLDDGTVLTENVAVLSYISTLDPQGQLAPKAGTLGFFKVVEWLAFVNGEVHKQVSPLFRPTTSEEAKAAAREYVLMRLGFVEKALADKPFLTGTNFTVADAYLYVILSWRERIALDISAYAKLTAFYERCRARPSVQQARKEEGLPA